MDLIRLSVMLHSDDPGSEVEVVFLNEDCMSVFHGITVREVE